ncbi:hypothetical protein ACFXPI_25365 [Streptomyces sp. NPDC059104]|uniref:hypothetical protein n=1 Tax=Streptomyces sp. NPDC059104 TaxID=3346729 RepID=UPI0036749CF7
MDAVAVTLDYPGHQERTRISDLADPALPIELHSLLSNPLPRAFSAEAYAHLLLENQPPTAPVKAVVSYCLASPIGYAVARKLSDGRSAPPVLVVLDGSPCPVESVRDAYREAVVRFAERDLEPAVAFTGADLTEHPDRVLGAMERELREIASRSLLEEDPDEDFEEDVLDALVTDLVGHSVAWLTHLIASHNAVFPEWDGEVVMVMSRDHAFTGPWPGARATRVITVDCTRAELVSRPEVRAVLTGLSSAHA